MCKVEVKTEGRRSCASGCAGSCSSSALVTEAQLKAAVTTLLTDEASSEFAQLSEPVKSALETVLTNAKTGLAMLAASRPGGIPVVVRRMKPRADEGPISGEAITARMIEICGCKGQYDCDCVSVQNLARQELWFRHNAGHEDPDRFERRRG